MRAALIALGTVVMGYAVLGAATDPGLKPGGVILFLAAVLVGHDAVLLPVTIAVGALVGRFAPRWSRPSIRAAAIVSLAVGVIALPLVLGYGRSADNPSVLPLAYGRGLVLLLIAVWAAALISAVLARRHFRDQRNLQPALGRPAGDGPLDHSERLPTGGLPTRRPSAGETPEPTPAAELPGNTHAEEPSGVEPRGHMPTEGPPVDGQPGRKQVKEPPAGGRP